MKNILIKGAGVGGLTVAFMLQQKGVSVTISAPPHSPVGTASWYAGGMLAPYCEKENAEQIVEDLGIQAIQWWHKTLPNLVIRKGTLVVAPTRDRGELERFSARTHHHKIINGEEIAHLEPDLAERFNHALFYENEAHLDPRQALITLKEDLIKNGVCFVDIETSEKKFDLVIDATGIARLGKDKNIRGVRGEMLLVRSTDIKISRPIRLLHPRFPLYIVPRQDNIFMIGATMIESDFDGAISIRSMMELLNAAYTLHPAFAEAEIIESGVGIRPSYPDNFPSVYKYGNHISINGFYRHGFLLSPEMATRAMKLALE
ncbi:glycine oxidase ThiO [Bartonella henselae]|uniref:D-amino-acid oxidase n=1 Tax=Bartonella henselae (strain ATCC 49882 / DSM 28221 / CCUG 30454 / Houston 1) TaxID=283166 RepID=A0A0H3M2W9_BARHE|nr:FAD-dependent oxidoreductase [Bartonella henselae]ATP12099.1 glycine oxidase [Bartonella henselae]ETS07883.1 glycine oxidase ThiO [Bartonella henselae JK 42]ETS09952.1 glycine oxidase ThiO [Bartonella henselae JK 50]ETS10462.1 glycine oxidase ThiO [Bartonella henselae JK 51]ETS12299.1 glycine oxidase ThiO [Bartonella henselae JK 41]